MPADVLRTMLIFRVNHNIDTKASENLIFKALACCCRHISAYLGVLPPPLNKCNSVKPLAGSRITLAA